MCGLFGNRFAHYVCETEIVPNAGLYVSRKAGSWRRFGRPLHLLFLTPRALVSWSHGGLAIIRYDGRAVTVRCASATCAEHVDIRALCVPACAETDIHFWSGEVLLQKKRQPLSCTLSARRLVEGLGSAQLLCVHSCHQDYKGKVIGGSARTRDLHGRMRKFVVEIVGLVGKSDSELDPAWGEASGETGRLFDAATQTPVENMNACAAFTAFSFLAFPLPPEQLGHPAPGVRPLVRMRGNGAKPPSRSLRSTGSGYCLKRRRISQPRCASSTASVLSLSPS
ncbi:hypothetical protein CSUI_001284 [Cystoisospora suis]|uniref:Uncharacterized protein n=1 Tax=Cystoisospora suis TaxID=483139 RepID=A0A2C6LB33_9APIC|nr:hypothetical protein CSUI_001284 [Cystoisospora suis]